MIGISLLAYGCESKNKRNLENTMNNVRNTQKSDSFIVLKYDTSITHGNIYNTTNRKIDLIYNGVNNYLGGQKNLKIYFRTECMSCEPVQEYADGILFSKRLLITNQKLKYFKTDFLIPDSLRRLTVHSQRDVKPDLRFRLTEGIGTIQHEGMSCNDANYKKVSLSYPDGNIIIDSLINATVFDCDIDKDGKEEQYLIGSRNCSQELVIIRIRH